MCWEICSIQIKDHVEDHYFDGNPALMQVFAELFPDANGHMCLQHGKKLTFSGGYKKLVPSIQEFIAFLPRNLRHVAAGDLLDRLGEAGQTAGRDYLALNGEGGAFTINVNGMLDAKWGSRFDDVEPGYSTFINNVPEWE